MKGKLKASLMPLKCDRGERKDQREEVTRIVTTSWDDGCSNDRRLIELLNKYNLESTLYIPADNVEGRAVIPSGEIRHHSQYCEIGSHTYSHVDLTRVSYSKAGEEIKKGKNYLEEILGEEVTMFCYPRGHYNDEVVSILKESGLKGARVTTNLRTDIFKDIFKIPVTMQIYPHMVIGYFKHFLKEKNYLGIRKYLKYGIGLDWLSLSKKIFDEVAKNGGIYHVWGHSWEIEELGLWNKLEELFKYISLRRDFNYVTNGNLIEILKRKDLITYKSEPPINT